MRERRGVAVGLVGQAARAQWQGGLGSSPTPATLLVTAHRGHSLRSQSHGPSPPHPAASMAQQSPPCPETEQSPPQVCPASGLPKGVRERTSPERWQQERRNAGLGREGQCLLGLDSRGHPLVLRSPRRAGRARGPTLGGAGCRSLAHTTETCVPYSSALLGAVTYEGPTCP